MAKKKKQTPKLLHHAKHLLVPHKGNEYRPHLIRWRGLTAVLFLAVGIQLGYGLLTTGHFEVLGRTSNIVVDDLLNDTNAERKAAGLDEIVLNDQLSKAAFAKAQDMFANNYWAHDSPTGVKPWKWLADEGYNYNVAGENLAKNYPNAKATVDAWMASSTHRANLLGEKYQDVGFAVVDGTLDGQDTTLVVAYYGAPVTGVAAVSDQKVIVAPVTNSVGNPLTYFGSAIQSLSPATVGVIGLLTIVAAVAALAHYYRGKLPKRFQKSWKLHHGAYKVTGMAVAVVIIIMSTGGGQI